MVRPEDRGTWLKAAQAERYEWAKKVDPEAVRLFNKKRKSRVNDTDRKD